MAPLLAILKCSRWITACVFDIKPLPEKNKFTALSTKPSSNFRTSEAAQLSALNAEPLSSFNLH